MHRFYMPVRNEHGSALLIAVLIIPVMTLFCVFASQIGVQDLQATGNDICHRTAFYNADGSLYGAAKLISQIAKDPNRTEVQAGTGKAAPGIEYLNVDSSYSDPAAYFVHLLTSSASDSTSEDLAFVKTNTATDTGLSSTVDIKKLGTGGTPAGGGAEFGSGSEGIGAQMNVVIYRLRAQGQGSCANSTATVDGDYWLITNKDGQTKGL